MKERIAPNCRIYLFPDWTFGGMPCPEARNNMLVFNKIDFFRAMPIVNSRIFINIAGSCVETKTPHIVFIHIAGSTFIFAWSCSVHPDFAAFRP
jgi:hypothetical protein